MNKDIKGKTHTYYQVFCSTFRYGQFSRRGYFKICK
jgi:hypothetical protein